MKPLSAQNFKKGTSLNEEGYPGQKAETYFQDDSGTF